MQDLGRRVSLLETDGRSLPSGQPNHPAKRACWHYGHSNGKLFKMRLHSSVYRTITMQPSYPLSLSYRVSTASFSREEETLFFAAYRPGRYSLRHDDSQAVAGEGTLPSGDRIAWLRAWRGRLGDDLKIISCNLLGKRLDMRHTDLKIFSMLWAFLACL